MNGRMATAPTMGANADGRLQVFGRSAEGEVVHAWQTDAGGAWSPWTSAGAPGHMGAMVAAARAWAAWAVGWAAAWPARWGRRWAAA